VAVCEPVEIDDDGDIFGRKRIDGTDPIFVMGLTLSRRVHVKDCLQVAVCEPVEIDDDGDS